MVYGLCKIKMVQFRHANFWIWSIERCEVSNKSRARGHISWDLFLLSLLSRPIFLWQLSSRCIPDPHLALSNNWFATQTIEMPRWWSVIQVYSLLASLDRRSHPGTYGHDSSSFPSSRLESLSIFNPSPFALPINLSRILRDDSTAPISFF